MFGHFMLVCLSCAFSMFSSIAFLLRSFSFPSVFLIGISDQIRSLVSFGCRGARLWRHPVNVVSSVVSFGGRGARLWRHPG